MRLTTIALFAGAALLLPNSTMADDNAKAKKDDKECCCKAPAMKIGGIASKATSVTLFRTLRHYFAKKGMPVEFILFSNHEDLGDALAKGQVDVAWNSPQAHAKFHLKHGDSQVVLLRDVDVDYRTKLLVRKDSGISSVGDLAGKSMIFGSCDSADCTVLPVYFLKKSGVDFDKVKILSLHDEVDEMGVPCHSAQHVLDALLKGRGQAGVIGISMWERLQKEKPEQAALLQEVWTSPPFTHCVFTARKDFCCDKAEQFRKVMLSMDGKDPVSAEILKLEHCTKWVPGSKSAEEGFTDLLSALRAQGDMPVSLRK